MVIPIRMGVIRRVSDGMELTFHRAFDTVSDHFAALEDVISIGCTRLLTSGCAQTAVEGQATLRELVDRSNGRISIVAGKNPIAICLNKYPFHWAFSWRNLL